MSITDARLDAVDRRGRAAARTLLDDLGAREAEAQAQAEAYADVLVAEDAPATWAGVADPGPAPTVIHLDRPAAPRRRRAAPGGRAWLAAAAAAALAVLALVGGIAVADRDDGVPDVSSGGPLEVLLPGWLPAGLEPAHAVDIPDREAVGYAADIAVYGDPEDGDDWSSTVGVVHLVADEELLGGPPSGGEAVTVGGHEARLRESEGLTGSGRAWEVEWSVDDGRLIVSGGLDPDEVLAAAETATTEPALDASALPEGYEEVARGPMQDSLLFTSLFEGNIGDVAEDAGGPAGLAVTYAGPSPSNDGNNDEGSGNDGGDTLRTGLVVAQRPGPASAVDLLRLSFPDAEATSVRGRHAVVGRGSEPPGSAGEAGVVAVQWAEPEGQLVTVVGFGVAEDAVLQVAERLRPATAGEVAALRDEHADPAPREFGEPPAGHVVAATGESRTGDWRVVADPDRAANVGALSLERMWGALASTTSETGERVEPSLDLQADISDGTVVVWGVLWVDAATVTVEAPDIEPVSLDLHEVDGWDEPVVAGAFPDDHFPPSTDQVVVVARDDDGREVGRNSTVLDANG